MCIGMANGGKTKVDKVENFIRETNEWHRVAELNANEIIRLQAENERLHNELHSKVEYIHEQLEIIENKKAEIERLKNSYKQCAYERDVFLRENPVEMALLIDEQAEKLKTIKAEAIKEFAERLKVNHISKDDKGKLHLLVEYNEFDNLVKEMVGEGK